MLAQVGSSGRGRYDLTTAIPHSRPLVVRGIATQAAERVCGHTVAPTSLSVQPLVAGPHKRCLPRTYQGDNMSGILAVSAFGWIVFAFIWVAVAFWPARVAGRKGHSFFGYFIFSLFFFPLALIMAYVVQDRAPMLGRA